jgi:HK97 family phage prohead protease
VSVLIADIDGTLTTTGDTPRQPLIDAINRAVMSGDFQVEIVSARSIDRLEETRAWLQEHGVAGIVGVHLNDFEGTPFATGLAFKDYKYGLLVEKYGDELEYAVDDNADVRAMALDKYEISPWTPEEAVSELTAEYPGEGEEDKPEEENPSSDAENASNPESRADLSVPDFMRQNAIRGLDLLEYKGDGLRPNTITEASDLEGVSPIAEGERPTAGQIAHLLWGSGDTTDKASRAYDYAERVVMAMDNEQERTDVEPTETPVETPTETPTEAPTEAPAEYHAVKGEVETRAYTGELRVDTEARTIVGYAALFNSDSSPMPFIERLAPGAFTRSLGQVAASGKVVKLLHGHDESQMLAATPTSLSLSQDERGLQVTADIIKSPIGDHLLALAQRDPQAIAWSFGFRVMDEDWDGNKRTVNEAALHEVSLLTGHTPAYPGTIGLASVRGLAKRRGIEAEGLWKAVSTWLRGDTVAEEDASAIIRAFEGSVTVPTSVRAKMLALKERIGE